MLKFKRCISVVLFICLMLAMILCMGKIMRPYSNERNIWDYFYDLEKDSVSVIIIGTSAAYRYYQPAQAWGECGFTSFLLANPAQPFKVVPYIFDEALRVQDPDVIVVELRSIVSSDTGDEIEETDTDAPDSATAVQELTRTVISGMSIASPHRYRGIFDLLSDDPDVPMIEYLFPVLKYHDSALFGNRELLKTYLHSDYREYYGSADVFLVNDQTENARKMGEFKPDGLHHLTDEDKELIDTIAAKAAKSGKKVLFMLTPYPCKIGARAVIAELNDFMRERQYDYLNSFDRLDEIDLDFSKDFYDSKHVNAFGAHKFTSWLAKYLDNRYTLKKDYLENIKDNWNTLASEWDAIYTEKAKLAEVGGQY